MSVTHTAEQIAARIHSRLTSRSVIYRRGAVEVPIPVTPLQILETVEQGDGARIRQVAPHWLIDVSALDLGDGPCQPQLGDQIVDGLSVFEVSGNDRSLPWEWESPAQLRFKVRTVMQ